MKISAIKLSDSNLKKFKAKEKKYCIWDSECPGFGVEITPAGTQIMVVKTCKDGRRSWHSLGRIGDRFEEWENKKTGRKERRSWTVDDFRHEAKGIKLQVKNGDDPKAAARARKAAVTVSELADRFIEEHIGAKVTWKGQSFEVEIIHDKDGRAVGNKESTAREHVRLIEKNIRPILGKMAVKDVGTSEIASLLFKLRRDHPTLSNRVRAVLSKMFSKAELWELRPAGSNPSRGQDRAPEHKKERNLSDKEIASMGAALRAAAEATGTPHVKRKEGEPKAESPFALAALRLAILAGMRKSEIIGDRYRGMPALTWADVDLEAGTLSVHHKTETRTGKKRTVYLCAAARKLLEALPRQLGNPHVIPGEVAGQSLVNLQAVWDRLRDQVTTTAKAEAAKTGQKTPAINLSDVTIHDLRRTFASVGARLGYPLPFLSALLGHAAGTITEIYARVDGDPLRIAVEAIGGRIAGLLSGKIDLAKEAEEAVKLESSAKA